MYTRKKDNHLLIYGHEHIIMDYHMVLPLSLLISRHIGFKEHVLVKHKTLSGHIEKPLYYTGFI